MTVTLLQGDCLELLPTLEANSIDSIVCDPPYGLSFMGKDWDYGVPGVAFWQAALRVAKPGAMLLAFGGTRTFHRLTVAIEDAGWEIRDCLMWLYGSGFPKSHNIGNGWGTALKPAWEPIIMARKPLTGTVADNVLAWGTGGINVDGCRIAADWKNDPSKRGFGHGWNHNDGREFEGSATFLRHRDWQPSAQGRWPANLILDEESARLVDEQSGVSKSTASYRGLSGRHDAGDQSNQRIKPYTNTVRGHNDTGGASRFFYCAKASKRDRDEGLEEMPHSRWGMMEDDNYPIKTGSGNLRQTLRHNHHPTVKPTALMRYLVRLVTPANGVVLDPFMGSGSTGKAAVLEGFNFTGIELDAEYLEIARRRIEAAQVIAEAQMQIPLLEVA